MANDTQIPSLDRFDTARFRMIVHISCSGMRAWLKNTEEEGSAPSLIASAEWAGSSESLLGNIESAFYDNPRLLDDYEADIIIDTPKVLFIPTSQVDDEELDTSAMMERVYGEDASDPLIDEVGDMLVAYTLCPGLKPFLDRTLAGAKVSNQLSLMVRHFGRKQIDDDALYMNLSEGRADVVAFRKDRFFGGASFAVPEPEDAAYFALNLLKTAGFDLAETDVYVSGDKEMKSRCLPLLRKYVRMASSTRLPAKPDFEAMPLAAALSAASKTDF